MGKFIAVRVTRKLDGKGFTLFAEDYADATETLAADYGDDWAQMFDVEVL